MSANNANPEPDHNTISITGLPSALCNTHILSSKQWFGRFGYIQHVCIFQHHDDIETTYIRYSNASDAAKAIKTMDLYQISGTYNTLRVEYNTNDICALFLNREQLHSDLARHHAAEITQIQTIHNIERVMFEEEIETLKQCISDTKRSLNVLQTQYDDEKLKLRAEIDRIRIKRCGLIRDYNILKQKHHKTGINYKMKYNAFKKRYNDVITGYEDLQHRYLCTQQQLEAMRCNCVFQKLLGSYGSPEDNNFDVQSTIGSGSSV